MEYFISIWDLLDIKPIKGRFTCSNKRLGIHHIASWLDKLLFINYLMFIIRPSLLHFCHKTNEITRQFWLLSSKRKILTHFLSISIHSGCKKLKNYEIISKSWKTCIYGSTPLFEIQNLNWSNWTLKFGSRILSNPCNKKKKK